jgi:hypothetical protein
VLHVRWIEEIGGLVGTDAPVQLITQIEFHRSQLVQQEELGSGAAWSSLGPRRVEELASRRHRFPGACAPAPIAGAETTDS